jgi:hypothetical protein
VTGQSTTRASGPRIAIGKPEKEHEAEASTGGYVRALVNLVITCCDAVCLAVDAAQRSSWLGRSAAIGPRSRWRWRGGAPAANEHLVLPRRGQVEMPAPSGSHGGGR